MIKFRRLPDWPERLAQFIESRRNTAFEWGVNDCALFAADAIKAMTDIDPASAFRGYQDERQAIDIVSRAGGMSAIAASCGLPEAKPAFAQRGDIALMMIEGRESFGVFSGHGWICGPGEDGVLFRPVSDAMMAFRV